MDILPSYREAISKPDWLLFVAPFVPASSWTSCCLVDRRFYSHFAPCLWQDPLVTIRHLGLHPNDDLAWYNRFIHKHAWPARLDVRCMVKSLDFRAFALNASGLYSTEASERAISESFRTLLELFPMLVCLLIDGHPELDPGSLATDRGSHTSHSLQLLDLAYCRQELTSKLFYPRFFRDLVYLDLSYVPGSLKDAIRFSLNPTYLPTLRVLKVQGREVDDATAQLLCETFRLQLWSLDLSNNKLTDRTIEALLSHCFSSLSFHNDSHFETEGKWVLPREIGSHPYGPFEFIQESTHSASFTHPERYLTDAPVYAPTADQIDHQWQTIRSDGTSSLRRDDAGSAKRMLLQKPLNTTSITPLHISRGGITHLFLNGNSFTTNGIGKLLRLSSGRLEHFECDNSLRSPLVPSVGEEQLQLCIKGLFDLSHLFRPVVSSNIRSLRVHHSLVTGVPEVMAADLSPITALRLSETVLFRNISRIYPQRFVPDMNPRIVSLTLTGIPARSAGPIIKQISSFLDLASLQQNAVKAARRNTNDRHSTILSGLRHIRLELNSDFSDDLSELNTGEDFDYDKLLDPRELSIGGNASGLYTDVQTTTPSKSRPVHGAARNGPADANAEQYSHWTSGRLKSTPYSDTESHFITHREEPSRSWTGNVYSVPVWIGPGTIGPHAAVNEYMWNLQTPNLRSGVGPATPSHVAAGVPPFTYIFYAAWDAMIFPRASLASARIRDTEPLRDVAAAIKSYRVRTTGMLHHWDGKLELVRTSQSSRYHASEYWR